MSDIDLIEPTETLSFQIAWESTLKCNLDCSYCGDGHNNRIPHPSLEESLKTVDFIVEYVDEYMKKKPKEYQRANLNIQGGESLAHPNIIEILTYAREARKKVDWYLGIATITNAVVKDKVWKRLVDLIDYFTISFHTESTKAQQDQVKKNILYLKQQNKNFYVAVLMHPKNWTTCTEMIEWCQENSINYSPRQIDHKWSDFRFNYTKEQTKYLTGKEPTDLLQKISIMVTKGFDLSAQGRKCCGGQSLCTNEGTCDFVKNKFKGWHCSVDQFFLYIRQTTGEVFTNKDCRMNFDGEIGPIGNLKNTSEILKKIKEKTDPIVCKKSSCWCGLCAPKAKTKDLYNEIILKYVE